MKTIYLDNNATTQVAPEVLAEMEPYFHELYGNPSSAHTFGGQVGRKIREARERTAALLGVEPDEILFTSCGSESDNAAIRSVLTLHPISATLSPAGWSIRPLNPFATIWPKTVTGLPKSQWIKTETWTWRSTRKALRRIRPLPPSCGATTKPASFSRWKRPRPLPKSAASCFIRMASRWRAKSPLT